MIGLTLIHKVVGGAMLFALIAVIILWQMAERRASKFERQTIGLLEKLRDISNEKNEQKQTTAGNIAKANQDRAEARVIVKRIRSAPNPANCGTPALDEVRNVL